MRPYCKVLPEISTSFFRGLKLFHIYLKPKKSMFVDLILWALLGLENRVYLEAYGTLGTDICSSLISYLGGSYLNEKQMRLEPNFNGSPHPPPPANLSLSANALVVQCNTVLTHSYSAIVMCGFHGTAFCCQINCNKLNIE